VTSELKIKNLVLSSECTEFLKDTELLSKAHSQKDKVLLDDIFVAPTLDKFDSIRDYEKEESFENILHNFCEYPRLLLAGENQSGKTTLCKKLFLKLRENNFVPIYIPGKLNNYVGKIENLIVDAFHEQYKGADIRDFDKSRVIPLLDDFHLAKKKEKHINDLSAYNQIVLTVDEIFALNVQNENIIQSFSHFKIREFGSLLRYKLIRQWSHLKDESINLDSCDNSAYSKIDASTELVNSSLGKIIGRGIMPAYPFFILSVLSINEAIEKPLDQEITSQGYCYQALIYLYMRKHGIKNDDFDTYINFLTEFAYYIFKADRFDISNKEFEEFLVKYLQKYNLPIKQEVLMNNLLQTQIVALDNLGNYYFRYPYLYYFFVAKYLAQDIKANEQVIDSIINNLHSDRNAYIAIFISHHSRNDYVLDEITLNALVLFDKYLPATLSKNELEFFDEQEENIIKAVLPSANSTPEKERTDRLKLQDDEESKKRSRLNDDDEMIELDYDLAMEIRRSVKTVEVMGRIIKNRAGSLDKKRIESIFEEAMKVHLRILSSFFEVIKKEELQKEIVDYMRVRIDRFIKEKCENEELKSISHDKQEKLAKIIFWNTNLGIIFGLIHKLVHSLGSSKLISIVESVCDRENTPASFLVKHGILMWYNKNLQLDKIIKRIDEVDFSKTAVSIMKVIIVNHCSTHSIGFKEKQKIEQKLKISSKRLGK
ncbi:MAG TPA: toll-Interleukin receptor, partial [candidate division Zixibacteria bacterium]|nr:toll-Interleukin receptor [candidate division Zixibacteria bacterium]